MANTQYKTTTLAPFCIETDSLAGSWPSPMRREPFAGAMRSQDSVLDGRRILLSQHGGGGAEFLVDNTGTGGASQVYPDATTWRATGKARTELAPGSVLVCRVVAVRSGPSEYHLGTGMGSWENAGNGGAVRFEIDYTNTAAQTAAETVQFGLLPTGDADGLEDTAAGSAWLNLEHRVKVGIRPGADLAEQAKWSEWPTVDLQISHRAGARVVHATIAEEAYEHVTLHTNASGSTANGVHHVAGLPSSIRYPVEEEEDGATYEEHRHGVHRLLYVAARQTARLGPRLAHWYAWDEVAAGPTDDDATPREAAGTTKVRPSWSFANANTTWDADAPGFWMPATRRAPENLASRVDGAASSPVVLRCLCAFAGTGSATGYLRVQTSPRSWLDLEVDQATVGTTVQWVTVTGWLETSIASDDTYPLAQDFAWTSDGGETLQVYGWDLSYGDSVTAL